MWDTHSLVIDVHASSAQEAQQFAQELEEELISLDPSVRAERTKLSRETMDLGATVAIVLGSAAVTAVANGIRVWLSKRNGATIDIDPKTGAAKVTGITSADAVKVTEILIGFSR